MRFSIMVGRESGYRLARQNDHKSTRRAVRGVGALLRCDSAPMHIAAAVGTPVVALFGPSGAFHWGPWDNNIAKFKSRLLESGISIADEAGSSHSASILLFREIGTASPAGKMAVKEAKRANVLII